MAPAVHRILPIGSLPAWGDSCCLDARQATWRPGTSAPEPTPVPHWLSWRPPPSNDEGGAKHPRARSLRQDLVPREGDPAGTTGAEAECKAQAPGTLAEDPRSPSGTGLGPSPGLPSGSAAPPTWNSVPSKFEAPTRRVNPLRADGEGRPNCCVCSPRLHLLLAVIVYPPIIYRLLYLAFWVHRGATLRSNGVGKFGVAKNSD